MENDVEIRYTGLKGGPFHVVYKDDEALLRWWVCRSDGMNVDCFLTKFFAARSCRKLNKLWDRQQATQGSKR